jgi:hypothetical protein
MQKFSTLIWDHVPHNKHRWQVESAVCEVSVADYDGSKSNKNAWLEIRLSETCTPEGSTRAMTRTISVTLDAKQRAALLAALSTEPANATA